MIKITNKDIIIEEEFVKAATDEEIIMIKEICSRVYQRIRKNYEKQKMF